MKEWFVDLLAWSGIIAWILASYFAFSAGNGVLFQAYGAFGISLGVAYFVIQRHAVPHPYGALENEQIDNKRLGQNESNIRLAQAQITLLAKALFIAAKSRNEPVSSIIEALAKPEKESIEKLLEVPSKEIEDRIENIFEERKLANESVLKTRRAAEIVQATIVILGTLQSGFGVFIMQSQGVMS